MEPKHRTDTSLLKLEYLIKNVGSYLLVFAVYVYVTNSFFSISLYITAVVIVIWSMVLVLAFRAPSERASGIRQGKGFILGYFCFLILFRVIIGYFYSVNPASLGQAISPSISQATSVTMQSSLENMLQNVFLIVSVSAPVGYAVTMWQKLRHHKVKQTLHGGLRKYKGMRNE